MAEKASAAARGLCAAKVFGRVDAVLGVFVHCGVGFRCEISSCIRETDSLCGSVLRVAAAHHLSRCMSPVWGVKPARTIGEHPDLTLRMTRPPRV